MGELLNSTLVKLVLAIVLTAASAFTSYQFGGAGKVPEARVEAVREQRSELIALVDFFTDHCQPVGPAPAVSRGVVERLSDTAQMQVGVK